MIQCRGRGKTSRRDSKGGLRSLSIHGSRIITAVDPVLTLPFELVHRFAQQAQRCELVQFFCQRWISRRESGTRQRLCSLRILARIRARVVADSWTRRSAISSRRSVMPLPCACARSTSIVGLAAPHAIAILLDRKTTV
jgi:hypothetical protein